MKKTATIWLTGLPASGKTTLAYQLRDSLREKHQQVIVLDGDELRQSLSSDLSFSEDDRHEHTRRVGAIACVLNMQGIYVIVSLISPYREDRKMIKLAHETKKITFLEIFLDTPLEECIKRDPKGLYAKALAGEIKNMTGINAPYEAPTQPDLHITATDNNKDILQKIELLL